MKSLRRCIFDFRLLFKNNLYNNLYVYLFSRLFETVENFIEQVVLSANMTVAVYPEDNFVLQAQDTPTASYQGVTFSVNINIDDPDQGFNQDSVTTTDGTDDSTENQNFIILPDSLLNDIGATGSASVRLTFSVFRDDALFQSRPEADQFVGFKVGGVIISAGVASDTPVQDLTNPVSVSFGKSMVCSPLTEIQSQHT